VDHDQRGFEPLWSLYPCESGWLFLAVADDAQWQRFATVVDPGLARDARFATARKRESNGAALRAAIAARLSAGRPLDWQQRLLDADVSAVAVDPNEGLVEFLIHRGLVDEAAHPDFGEYWRHRPLVRFSRSVAAVRAPCGLGEHTDEVLAELGIAPGELDDLVTRGVAGRAAVPAR
jgi:crotonobetainyl-CoA:carnitine CoA-transferase CaiB-like acyl-CoA transferase